MIDFLISLIPVSLGIWCINVLFQDGHILEKAGDWMELHFPEEVNKPLWMCPICQSSFWGLVGFFAVQYFFDVYLTLKLLIPFIFCLCGLNTIIAKATSKERIIIDE